MSERNLDPGLDQFTRIGEESSKIMDTVQKNPEKWIHVILFILTLTTTTLAGAQSGFSDSPLMDGLSYSIPLLTILLFHEFGHYFLARKHGIKATFPYFLPVPLPPVGTFGAVIKIRSPFYNRKALFDVGVAGPLAGVIIAIPVTIVGLYLSKVIKVTHVPGIYLGSSLLFSFLSDIIWGTLPANHDIFLHPMAFAGWVGLFVTALNLMPIGQLDGGHVLYAMFGEKRHRTLPYLIIPVLLILGVLGLLNYMPPLLGIKDPSQLDSLGTIGWPGWLLWVGLMMIMLRIGHPAPIDPSSPLDRKRKILGWIALILFILTFIPSPITVAEF
jgi:membrane-associated protease RseP (regulator of RpoE activity)